MNTEDKCVSLGLVIIYTAAGDHIDEDVKVTHSDMYMYVTAWANKY